jgi:hypothetical protein
MASEGLTWVASVNLTFPHESGPKSIAEPAWTAAWQGESKHTSDGVLRDRDGKSGLEPGGLNAERVRASLRGE